ncbi:hypothetical protein BH11GEM1_BH11GEM1_00250 [soil metagenome]
MRLRPEGRRARWLLGVLMVVVGQPSTATAVARAQEQERPDVMRALELENDGKYKEAAALFRAAIRTAPSPNAALGLERVYAELGMSDSLLAPLDTIIAQHPREPTYRTIQLRTLQTLRRDERLREAFEQWVRAVPRDATPFREYARLLIQLGRAAVADSIVKRGRTALGSLRDLEYENAQLRAAMGEWQLSAQSWRRALPAAPHLAIAAAYSLASAPPALRDSIRAALTSLPADPGSRRALAELALTWNNPREAWGYLAVLRPDTAVATIWEDFGDRAYTGELWSMAHDAFVAALKVRWTAPLATRAATAALRAGAAGAVAALVPLDYWGADSLSAAREFLPLNAAALVALGHANDADRLVARFDHLLVPAQRMRLAQALATAWVRAGDLPKARAALRAAGPEAESGEAAGWLALYDGHLAAARTLLRTVREPSAELALAMGIVARARGDTAPDLGAAFLTLARGDSIKASAAFVAAAAAHQEVAPALLLVAARLRAVAPDAAIPIWARIVAEYPASPEAVESELEWARVLRRRGDTAAAATHLEHLILGAPQSALLPQARRELELARGAVPPGS